MEIPRLLVSTSIIVPGLVALLSAAPVRAEVRQLDLKQVVELSVQNNGELRGFREEKGIRDAGKVRAGLLPNPTLEFDGATGALTGSPDDSSVSLGLSQELLLGGKRERRLAVAERELELYRWQLVDRQRLLVAEVRNSYYDLLLAQERVALAERSMSLAGQLVEVARERLAAGDIPELELNLAKVELARAAGSKVEAQRAQIMNRTRLLALMGGESDEEIRLTDKLAPASGMLNLELSALKQAALAQRPDLKALQAEKGRGEADVDLARAESIPNLTAGIAFSRDRSSMEVSNGLQGRDTAYKFGFRLSIPLPVFDRNQAGLQEARARLSSSESRLPAASRVVEREVEAAYAGYRQSAEVLSLYRGDILPQLEENLALVQEAYRVGEIGILNVIAEQKKFFEVNDAYLSALYNFQNALVKLETAAGAELSGNFAGGAK